MFSECIEFCSRLDFSVLHSSTSVKVSLFVIDNLVKCKCLNYFPKSFHVAVTGTTLILYRDASRGDVNRGSLTSACLMQPQIFARRRVWKVVVSEHFAAHKLFNKMSALYIGSYTKLQKQQKVMGIRYRVRLMNADRISKI